MKGLGRVFLFLLGVAMIPVDVGFAIAFSENLIAVRQVRSSEHAFLLGITAYLAVHAMLLAPTRAYVFGHELVHAAAAWVTGGKVKSMKVGAKSGSVTTDKITAFTALAPYLVPVYAVLWAGFFGAASLFCDISGWVWTFFFGLGAALAFHLVFTVTVLKEKQPDLEVAGPVLSLALIFWGNISLVLGTMALIVPEVRFVPYLVGGFENSVSLYQAIARQLFGV